MSLIYSLKMSAPRLDVIKISLKTLSTKKDNERV